MEQTLLIIDIVILLAIIIFIGTIVWQRKSRHSMPCRVTRICLQAVLFALQIPKLIMEIYLNLSYGMTVLLLWLWALSIVYDSFLIGYERGKQSALLGVVIKIMDDTIERSKENSEEESDNQ